MSADSPVPAGGGFAERHPRPRRTSIPPRARAKAGDPDVAPPSFAQQRLWLVDAIEGAGPLYNMPVPVRVAGPLRVDALEAALDEVLRRHESLRTVFPAPGGEPVQEVLAPWRVKLPAEDLRPLRDDERQARIRSRLEDEEQRPFDLARGPLFRASLLRLADEEHLLLLGMHHIVTDGWSLGVLFHELGALYPAFRDGKPSPLPEPVLQYADYAVWQRERLRGDALEAELAYWRPRLAGAPALLELPWDRPRPAVQSHRGAVHRFRVQAELEAKLRELAGSARATPFMALLAAFDVLAARYAGHDDVVVGTPIAGRTRPELMGLVGFFTNTLVVRTDCSGDPSFRELLERVREVTLGAFEHQETPFEKLVEELRVERDLSRNPLFQAVFQFRDLAGLSVSRPGFSLRLAEAPQATAKFDLVVDVARDGAELAGTLGYATDLFDAATAERMAGHYLVLLRAVADDPDRRISELPLLAEAERRRVVLEWNPAPRAHAGGCVHEMVAAQAARTPERVAVACAGQELSYAELDARANRLAHHLQAAGVGPEARVGVCLERGAELVAALLAVLKAGGAYVPLDPAYPAERLAWMLTDSGATVVLTSGGLRDRLPRGGGVRLVCLDADAGAVAARPASAPRSGARPQNLAYLIYTSGSTGRPKGVGIAHGSACALLRWAGTAFSARELSRTLASTTVCFDVSVFELFAPLAHGGTVAMVRDSLQLAAAGPVTLAALVPSVAQALLAQAPLPPSLQTVVLGGEPLLSPLVEALARAGVRRVLDGYGPSEDTTYSTMALRRAGAPATIGRPVAGSRVYVVDRHLRPCPVGVPGELLVGGAGLARGYLGRPALTAGRFVPDPFGGEPGGRLYRTGDRVRWRAAGELEYMGRYDHQVKVRGHRIDPGEVETALRAHPAVADAAAVAAGEGPERRLVACVVPAPGSAAQGLAGLLRDHVRARLPAYMVPAEFVVLDALPLTPSGKVDRRALPPAGPARRAPDDGYVAPRTPAQEALCAVWGEVLRAGPVGIHDNFFDIGGTSLTAVRVSSELRAGPRMDVPVARIFETPTVASLHRSILESEEVPGRTEAASGVWLRLRAMPAAEKEALLRHAHAGAAAEPAFTGSSAP